MLLIALLLFLPACDCGKCDDDPPLCLEGLAVLPDDPALAPLASLEGEWTMVDCDGVSHVVELPPTDPSPYVEVESSTDEMDACGGATILGLVVVTYDGTPRRFEGYVGVDGYGFRGSLGTGNGWIDLHASGTTSIVDVQRNDCVYADIERVE